MSQIPLAIAYLIAVHTLWLTVVIPNEVKSDLMAINKDGSKDSLKKKWHRLSALKIGFFAVLSSLPALYFGWYVSVILVVCLSALFWRFFDIGINIALKRERDYVGYTAEIDRFYRRRYSDPERKMRLHKDILIAVSYIGLILSLIYALNN